jgi:hypothetical protein
MLLVEWQTKVTCQFIGASIQVHLKQGAANPLIEHASEISIFPKTRVADPDDPRGEVTGYMNGDGVWEQVKGPTAPPLSTLGTAIQAAGPDGDIEGVQLGDEMDADTLAIGQAAKPGSFEAFMGMFGPNGKAMPANTAPQPT